MASAGGLIDMAAGVLIAIGISLTTPNRRLEVLDAGTTRATGHGNDQRVVEIDLPFTRAA